MGEGAQPKMVTAEDALAAGIRTRLGPAPAPPDPPLVSIVVLNRNGAAHLRRLLSGLTERTAYRRFELIVIDNGSDDDSLPVLREAATRLPISIVANSDNRSFSDGCNRGHELATGELLLFLNNDVVPFEAGWLGELVECLMATRAGVAAATLVCPDVEHERDFDLGYGVQHRGIAFIPAGDGDVPSLRGWEDDPLDEELGRDVECEAVAAACMLIARTTFGEAGRFTDGYFYGCEDVDLCLKLRARGMQVVCSGRSVAIHHPVSTRRTLPFEQAREQTLANRRLLWERWGPRLNPHHERPAR